MMIAYFLLLIVPIMGINNAFIKFNGCFSFKSSTGSDTIFYRDKVCNSVTEQSCFNDFDLETRSKVELLKYECNVAPIAIIIESDILGKYPKLHTVDISHLDAPSLNVILSGRDVDNVYQYQSYNVTALKAFNNELQTIPKSLFVLMPYVRDIDFSYNQFQTLKSTCFDGAQELNKINFSHNHLSSLENGVFVKLHKLNELDLSSNHLQLLDSHAFLADDNM